MSAGPKAARAEVYALLNGLTGVGKVLDHEPLPDRLPRPTAITISPAGFTATDWRTAVRLYVDTRSDVEKAQDTLDDLALAADNALDDVFARSQWDVEFSPELEAFVATTILESPREDF